MENIKCPECGEINWSREKLEDSYMLVCDNCRSCFDFQEYVDLPIHSYNSNLDVDIYNCAFCIIKYSNFCDSTAKQLHLDPTYVELIYHILDNITISDKKVFEYGTSPRGLFKNENYDLFLTLYKDYILRNWEENAEELIS